MKEAVVANFNILF